MTNQQNPTVKQIGASVDFNKAKTIIASALDLQPRELSPDNFFKQYTRNKQSLFEAIGEQPTISKNIQAYVSNSEVYSLIRNCRYELVRNDLDRISTILDEFIEEEFKTNTIMFDETANGTREYLKSIFPHYSKGMKLSKFISKTAKQIYEDETLTANEKTYTKAEYTDIIYSKYQNKVKYNGVLTLSADINDYLTMSVNNSGWESCHNIFDGCHASGALSYATDSTTLIAYAHNGKESEYRYNGLDFTHNSKNWRACVYVSENRKTIYISRQYPNSNKVIIDELISLLKQTFTAFTYEVQESENLGDFINSCDEGLAYNDLSYNYTGYALSVDLNNKESVNIGNMPYCPQCGDEKIYDCEIITCCDGTFQYCEDCGERHREEDMTWIQGHGYVCNDCLNDNYGYCDECETYHRTDYMYTAYNWRGREIYVCESCLDNFTCCEHCGEYHPHDNMIQDNDGYYYCSQCADELLICCDQCGEYYSADDTENIDGYNYCYRCAEAIREQEQEEQDEESAI